MRIAVVAGARPNFPKVAPLLDALAAEGIAAALVHTGQHYDWAMSQAFFADLGLPEPDVDLEVGSGSHAAQTARVMEAFDGWLSTAPVDAVATVGDVNSTVACALVAAKRGLPVAHVEAGLRCFDRSMPEEINRVVTDAVSTWLFTPSADADDNLRREGVDRSRIFTVGNVMVDSLLANLSAAVDLDMPRRLGLPDAYGLITLHRPALVDDPAALRPVLEALDELGRDLPLVLPAHPRTRANLTRYGLDRALANIRLLDPLGYLPFLGLEAGATLVLTDSGGVQEETTVLGVPCLTLRPATERPVTVTEGTNRVVGVDGPTILDAARVALEGPVILRRPPLWDGNAATRIAAVLRGGTPPVDWGRPQVAGAVAPSPARSAVHG